MGESTKEDFDRLRDLVNIGELPKEEEVISCRHHGDHSAFETIAIKGVYLGVCSLCKDEHLVKSMKAAGYTVKELVG